jgi:hypothetical protein
MENHCGEFSALVFDSYLLNRREEGIDTSVSAFSPSEIW